ncbi:MAG: hypothetical protein IJ906_15770 [Oscillospiraceae bacterium]|nr:hypothetical protein [Oscillospiraceae bacterium]
MKPRRVLVHVLADLAVIAAVIGIPMLLSAQQTDAVSSATTVIDAPSGEFVILLNRGRLTEDSFWEQFFSGQDVDFCFEDITCTVAKGDQPALTMAQSFQSRLAEHQMTIRQEDMTLMLSKADHGRFQVMILSKEPAEQNHAESAVQGNVTALRIGQEEVP